MQWTSKIKRRGVVEQSNSGYVPDPLWVLGNTPKEFGLPKATVESKVSHWGEHVSISFSVTLECPQTQEHVAEAARMAFITATRFVNEAVSRLDSSMPMLPTG